ncbi:uncharacterized protein LOC128955867 [Oppia nitens]|uniref:uncharacterized protein LOC128955867 n=1 Tax=Oppia nitens TaxID=1686743 RepID=UPI0023DB56B5|nr:uncharacterized protein LOC128955867 [Oppia nitens]
MATIFYVNENINPIDEYYKINNKTLLSSDKLKQLTGVKLEIIDKISFKNFENDNNLSDICGIIPVNYVHSYDSTDITCEKHSPEPEHFHLDNEIIVMQTGIGFLLVRTVGDELICIVMTKGYKLTLPAGCIHSFRCQFTDKYRYHTVCGPCFEPDKEHRVYLDYQQHFIH